MVSPKYYEVSFPLGGGCYITAALWAMNREAAILAARTLLTHQLPAFLAEIQNITPVVRELENAA